MHRSSILVLTTVPADLRQRLAVDYDLVDIAAAKQNGGLVGYSIALTTSMAGVTDELMSAAPDLRLVACNGAGLDKIDLAAAARRGVAIAHTPDELTEDTADFAIALLYATMRRTVEADRFVRAGRWLKERMQPSRRIFGKSLGIVGLGRIGAGVARRATGLGMSVAYHGRSRKAGVAYPYEASVTRLAEMSDVLVLCCSGGPETRHLVNADLLHRLGPQGVLINIARGSVVDEEALIAALQDGTIAAAGLDVFSSEPNIDQRFLAMDNVVVQPHYASLTHETRAAMIDRIAGDISAFLGGKPFFNAAAKS